MYFTYPQVNLKNGLPADSVNSTCLAGAGTLVLEFGILSRLLGDPVYESYARRAVDRLWEYRSNVTGLLGMLYAFIIRYTLIYFSIPLTILTFAMIPLKAWKEKNAARTCERVICEKHSL